MLEKQIESAVCEYAKKRGTLVYKFTSPARRAVPDRLFITPQGVCYFIEFKREGQKPTPPQVREHERLKAHNVLVFVIDNIDRGKFVIDVMQGGA